MRTWLALAKSSDGTPLPRALSLALRAVCPLALAIGPVEFSTAFDRGLTVKVEAGAGAVFGGRLGMLWEAVIPLAAPVSTLFQPDPVGFGLTCSIFLAAMVPLVVKTKSYPRSISSSSACS